MIKGILHVYKMIFIRTNIDSVSYCLSGNLELFCVKFIII